MKKAPLEGGFTVLKRSRMADHGIDERAISRPAMSRWAPLMAN